MGSFGGPVGRHAHDHTDSRVLFASLHNNDHIGCATACSVQTQMSTRCASWLTGEWMANRENRTIAAPRSMEQINNCVKSAKKICVTLNTPSPQYHDVRCVRVCVCAWHTCPNSMCLAKFRFIFFFILRNLRKKDGIIVIEKHQSLRWHMRIANADYDMLSQNSRRGTDVKFMVICCFLCVDKTINSCLSCDYWHSPVNISSDLRSKILHYTLSLSLSL